MYVVDILSEILYLGGAEDTIYFSSSGKTITYYLLLSFCYEERLQLIGLLLFFQTIR